jgi:hypothetical protein
MCLSATSQYLSTLDLSKFNNCLQLIKWKLCLQKSHDNFIPNSRVKTTMSKMSKTQQIVQNLLNIH